ncbi:potassium channel family protein [Sulfuriroseicoccus oceanibius]|uniref:NAD-binding protein n=1 Tax=Sulfuriroseicoccus oceanibius TaxID=2707525 RepID=A0A6B3L5T6_9BACT|nr:ion channel [Sulfuriroseicoccus oceanibius]QQL45675.1 NAD-binding protein [Sulfuriroseicoccus oceanibius]
MFFLLRKWFNRSHRVRVRVANALMLALVLNLVFGLLFYAVEHPHHDGLTLEDSIWWAMVTMTTVGYGDYYPVTFVGRYLIAYPCFLIGIGFIGSLIGIVVDSVIGRMTKKRKGYSTMYLKNHHVICHCPSEGKVLQIVSELRAAPGSEGVPVVVISPELDEQPVSFREREIQFVKGDPTAGDVLQRAAVCDAAGVLVLAANPGDASCDAETFAIASVVKLTCNNAESRSRLVLEMVSRSNRELLDGAGADGIVATEGISDQLLVQELCNPGLSDVFDQLISYKFGAEFYLTESSLSGTTLEAVQIEAIRGSGHVQVLGLLRDGKTMFAKGADTVIRESDQLIVLAESLAEFQALEQRLQKSA